MNIIDYSINLTMEIREKLCSPHNISHIAARRTLFVYQELYKYKNDHECLTTLVHSYSTYMTSGSVRLVSKRREEHNQFLGHEGLHILVNITTNIQAHILI